MQAKDILEKAIKKAIDGGWSGKILGITVRVQSNGILRLENHTTTEEWSVEEIIFNHNFASALWPGFLGYIPGINENDDNPEEYWKLMNSQINWGQNEGGAAYFKGLLCDFHLQQMVIADDPVKYLGDNI
jgi:hypothetical protein